MGNMKKLAFLLLIGAVIAISGCTATPESADRGSLEILVSDQPSGIDDFTYLNVKLSEIRVFKTDSGFETYSPAVDSFDLTKLKGDNALALINATLDEGSYTKIEFIVESLEGETANVTADIRVPSNKLMITKNFEVEPNKTASFVFDINVVKTGQTNEYNLLPVISESGIVGKDIAANRVRRVTREQARAHVKGSGQGVMARLTIQEAKAKAKGTECTEKGSLREDSYTYNENSRTWWIDLDMKPEHANPLCSPACVISEDDDTVEINWRCTGALPPGTDGGSGSATGQFSLFVTDAPADIGDFSELTVNLQKVMIHKSADGDNGSKGEWLEYDLNISSFDLTQLVDGNVLEVISISLPAGMYTQVRLEAESASGLVGNDTVSIFVPSGTLKIVKPFMVGAGKEVEFLFDINVVRKGSVMGNGKSSEYNLLPVIGNSGVWDSQNQNPAVCGNGQCEVGENNQTCPSDCLPPANDTNQTNGTQPVCGDGTCDPDEDYVSCPEDCSAPAPICVPEINCTTYCINDVLFENGTCVNDACVFQNMTCQFGCANTTACDINQTA